MFSDINIVATSDPSVGVKTVKYSTVSFVVTLSDRF